MHQLCWEYLSIYFYCLSEMRFSGLTTYSMLRSQLITLIFLVTSQGSFGTSTIRFTFSKSKWLIKAPISKLIKKLRLSWEIATHSATYRLVSGCFIERHWCAPVVPKIKKFLHHTHWVFRRVQTIFSHYNLHLHCFGFSKQPTWYW